MLVGSSPLVYNVRMLATPLLTLCNTRTHYKDKLKRGRSARKWMQPSYRIDVMQVLVSHLLAGIGTAEVHGGLRRMEYGPLLHERVIAIEQEPVIGPV
jgi:hypothetical protein